MRFGSALVINQGSAGDARDTGNGRQLSCAVLDTVSEKLVVNGFPGSVPVEPGNLKFTIQGLERAAGLS